MLKVTLFIYICIKSLSPRQRPRGDPRGEEAGHQPDDAADAGDAAVAHERGQLGLCRPVAVPPGAHRSGIAL